VTHGFAFRDGDQGREAFMPTFEINGKRITMTIDGWQATGLIFAGAGDVVANRSHDEVLTALEARGLRLEGTQLAILSDCVTGVGDATRNRGILAMRTAFRAAGARQVISTLWNANDTFAREFMVKMHTRIAAGETPVEALRATQIEYLNTAGNNPYQWAAFVHTGDPGPI
jgi:CHAT domain-containing protein